MITLVNALVVKDAMFSLNGKVQFLLDLRTKDGKHYHVG
jgi:hypothetical protein